MRFEMHRLGMIAACAAYTLAGPMLILLNNHILHGLSFPYPIALSAFGVTFSAVVCRLLIISGLVPLARSEPTRSRRFFVLNTLPLAALAALTLALGNSAYIYLTVATCQILKALTPGMTLSMAYALRIEEPDPIIISSVLIICIGTAMASSGEMGMSSLGLFLQLSANLSEACRVVLSQRLISGAASLPLIEMQYHIAPWQSLCLLATSAAVELRTPADRAAAFSAVAGSPLVFMGASALGLGLQIGALLVIKAAGSVTMKLLGIFRNGALVLFEAARGAEYLQSHQLAGHALSTGAFFLYTLVRLGYVGAAKPAAGDKKVKSM